MRIAVLSDIHGNRTAFEAVLKDLREMAPDLVLHGGDLADSGSSAVEIVDRIRDLGWPGVMGNTDEMLFAPQSLRDFAAQVPQLQPLMSRIEEMAVAAREALGNERLEWLRCLPRMQREGPVAVVHASEESLWRSPMPEASDAELLSTYRPLNAGTVVYGHVHRFFTRAMEGLTVANSGSVGRPYDGDPRAGYLLLNDGNPEMRRVSYDVDAEIRAMAESGLPHYQWVAKALVSGQYQMP